MLISPPFLTERGNDVSDAQWIEQTMVGGVPGQGGYPVSFNLGWHGGIHLEAPSAGNSRHAVRAIADGTVVYMRKSTEVPCGQEDDHPLNYRGGWTSDGCVIIKHETEIGAAANGQATQVTFYSITMHLEDIDKKIKKGKKVYRKDVIGKAGYIYGDPYKIHFEIICDCENLAKLVGRQEGELDTSKDGRNDVVYGELYFKLPAWTEIYTTQPAANIVTPQEPSVHTLDKPVYVGIRYAAGDGAQGQRGDAYVTTYQEDGTIIGDVQTEPEAEYQLYASATKISDAYRTANAKPKATQTPVPAPSAVYELLRFGRVIGPDELIPADTPHWRKICYGEGHGWVNLNASGVVKFSDADFPHWKGWKLIDDTADLDSRCDSATIKGWLDEDRDGKVDPNEAVSLLSEDRIQDKMRRTICKLPTEWEKATVDHRWNWLTKETDENPVPLSNADFLKLREHIEELAFWEDANIGISSSHWHFHPREFIRQFRMCGWLSRLEIAQLLPRTSYKGWPRAVTTVTISWETAFDRWANLVLDLNKSFRKYLIVTPTRQAHFFAQVYIETDLVQVLREYGRGRPSRNGTWPAPAMQYYTVFYGRGLMQLTWADNYASYGNYRSAAHLPNDNDLQYGDPYARITATSQHYWADPRQRGGEINNALLHQWAPRYDPELIADNTYNAADSGGFYWVSKSIGRGAININQVCDRGMGRQAVSRVSVLVNGGSFGYFERQAYAAYVSRFLLDRVDAVPTEQFVDTNPSGRAATVTVDYTPQRQ